MLILSIYLAIGFLMNFIGPLAKVINKEIKEVKKTSFADLPEKSPIIFWKKVLFELIRCSTCSARHVEYQIKGISNPKLTGCF